jgi:glycosyltransferase involved in cell wall biosynthesis
VTGLEEMRRICAEVYSERLYMDNHKFHLALDLLRNTVTSAPILATKYAVGAMLQRVHKLLAEQPFDVVHLDMLHLGEFLPVCRNKPLVLVEHNVESVILARRADNESNPLSRAYIRHQHHKLQRYEARLCQEVDHVITVSDLDAQTLQRIAPTGHYTTIPNGVDTTFFRSSKTQKKPNSLIYVGGLSWHPNLDAIRYFCSDVLPPLRRIIPEVQLTVVGKLPGDTVPDEFRGYPEVHFAGLVGDVRPYIDEASAYIVPLRIGGGTRLKILDALAMNQSVVTTSVGCEGLAVTNEQHVLVADDAASFAAQVGRVLQDRGLATALGDAGRKLVEEQYEWAAIARKLDGVYQSVSTKPSPEMTRNPDCDQS